jgi:hypothetical protein
MVRSDNRMCKIQVHGRRYNRAIIAVDIKSSLRVHNRRCKVKGKLHMLCVINWRRLIFEKHGTVVMFRFLIRVSKRVFPEQYYQTIVLSTSVPERRQRVGGIILVVMVNRLAPLSRSEGRARREPFGGVGSTGWLYKPPARLSPAHCYFSTQPSFLLDKLLPDTSLH